MEKFDLEWMSTILEKWPFDPKSADKPTGMEAANPSNPMSTARVVERDRLLRSDLLMDCGGAKEVPVRASGEVPDMLSREENIFTHASGTWPVA